MGSVEACRSILCQRAIEICGNVDANMQTVLAQIDCHGHAITKNGFMAPHKFNRLNFVPAGIIFGETLHASITDGLSNGFNQYLLFLFHGFHLLEIQVRVGKLQATSCSIRFDYWRGSCTASTPLEGPFQHRLVLAICVFLPACSGTTFIISNRN